MRRTKFWQNCTETEPPSSRRMDSGISPFRRVFISLFFLLLGIGFRPRSSFSSHFIPLQAVYIDGCGPCYLFFFHFLSESFPLHPVHLVLGACFLSLAFDTTCASHIYRISLGLTGPYPLSLSSLIFCTLFLDEMGLFLLFIFIPPLYIVWLLPFPSLFLSIFYSFFRHLQFPAFILYHSRHAGGDPARFTLL